MQEELSIFLVAYILDDSVFDRTGRQEDDQTITRSVRFNPMYNNQLALSSRKWTYLICNYINCSLTSRKLKRIDQRDDGCCDRYSTSAVSSNAR